jgi:hypothetical protein
MLIRCNLIRTINITTIITAIAFIEFVIFMKNLFLSIKVKLGLINKPIGIIIAEIG